MKSCALQNKEAHKWCIFYNMKYITVVTLVVVYL